MKVSIAKKNIEETSDVLKKFGKHGFEGLVLWIGPIANEVALVEQVLTPPQTPIRSENGVGYLVSGETLFAINRYLNETGLRLIAQVHSHPTNAYHSKADDELAIVTREGFFSLVVPDFGYCPASINEWAVYRLNKGKWKLLSNQDLKGVFQIT